MTAAGVRPAPRAQPAGQQLRADKVCIETVFPLENPTSAYLQKAFISPALSTVGFYYFFPPFKREFIQIIISRYFFFPLLMTGFHALSENMSIQSENK